MKKFIVLFIGLFLIISFSPFGFSQPDKQNLQIDIIPDKQEYLVGELAIFEIEIKRNNQPTQILPEQIIATFPDEETQVTLSYISKGHYRYTSFPLEVPGNATLTIKIYRPGTLKLVTALEQVREKFKRRIELLEKLKEEETREKVIRWLNLIISKYQALIEKIDKKIAEILNKHLLAQKSTTINVILLPPETPEETLEIIERNNRPLLDMKADMTLNSELNGELFGEVDYSKYYFKQADKIKIESYLDEERTNKRDTIIIGGSSMHLIHPQKEGYQTVNLLEEGNIDASQFNQMNIFFDLNAFLEGHNVVIKETNPPELLSILEAKPKATNNLYSKLELHIDYYRGLLLKWKLFKLDESGEEKLVQTMEVLEYKNTEEIWVPTKMVKIPNLSSGKEFKTTMKFSHMEINTGILDDEFNPELAK